MLTNEFKKEIENAINCYLSEAYQVNEIGEADNIQSERRLPLLEIAKIVNSADASGENMKRLIRYQLDNLQDTGKIKTGRSRLKRLMNKILSDERFSDYEFVKDENEILRKENAELKKSLKLNRNTLFAPNIPNLPNASNIITTPNVLNVLTPRPVSAPLEVALADYDPFSDGGDFLMNSL